MRVAALSAVGVTLDIAGAGSRSYAFLIDWQIRLLLALAWFCGGWLLIKTLGTPSSTASSRVMALAAVAPALGIYLLYHPVVEILMHGRTPGKRRAGVRIVTRQGGVPGAGALLLRNVLRLVDSLPFFYVVGLASCFITAQRVRIGDLAAGTVLVLDHAAAAKSLVQLGSMVSQSGLAPELVQLISDLLGRWPSLDVERRDQLARAILARADSATSAADLAALSDGELPQRLRWLLQFGRIGRS
jgi:uncharacterized RDD family membrane protein YckC